MIAGFLPLVFNPQAWIAVGVALFIGFSGGVVKGWNASNADHWRAQVTELQRAAAQKEAIIKADAKRAEADQSEIARLNATLESVIHEHKMSSCKLSPAELVSLRRLASGKH
jgi:hypothetical protein